MNRDDFALVIPTRHFILNLSVALKVFVQLLRNASLIFSSFSPEEERAHVTRLMLASVSYCFMFNDHLIVPVVKKRESYLCSL